MAEELEYKLENCYMCDAPTKLDKVSDGLDFPINIRIKCSGCGKTALYGRIEHIDFLVAKWNSSTAIARSRLAEIQ